MLFLHRKRKIYSWLVMFIFCRRLNSNYRKYLLLSFLIGLLFAACNEPQVRERRKAADYIREIAGENDSIPVLTAQKGEVLIAYSDCYTCHKQDKKSIGPAFKDIAKRYPVQQAYISMLGWKIINGGSGSWGQAVMIAHPSLSVEDAEIMVKYILSLKQDL